MIDFMTIGWADSDLERVVVEYDKATLTIWNDMLSKRMDVKCFGLAGITNLCVWDDTFILKANVRPASDIDNEFLRSLYAAYDKDYDDDGRSLSSGLIELRIELTNHIPFSVYCQRIEVVENNLQVIEAQE